MVSPSLCPTLLPQRLTARCTGATVILLEGLFVLHDPAIRELLDLKIFVQADSDLMLARRLRRDIAERGRDVNGVLDQVRCTSSTSPRGSTP